MIRGRRTSALMVLRITAAFISAAVLIVTVVVAPPTPTASGAEVKTAIFGTVAALP